MPLNSRNYHLARSGETNNLVRSNHAVPEPDHHQVLIRIAAASLNYRDLLTQQDITSNRADLIPLSDGAGTVVAVGSEVSQWKERRPRQSKLLALCGIQWVIKFHFSTEKINHVDKVMDIAVTPGASFG